MDFIAEVSHFATPLKLILIEDDALDRRNIRLSLEKTLGAFTLEEFSSAASGLNALSENRYDCLILDFRLPDQDGLAVLNRLKESHITLPTVVITGYGDELLVVEILKSGALDYIPKDKLNEEMLARSIINTMRLHNLQELAIQSKKLIEQANTRATSKSYFLSQMSHEIRTPLSGIIGLINILADTPLNAVQKDLIKSTQEACDHLVQLLNSILDLSKIEACQFELNQRPLNLKEIISTVMKSFEGIALENHNELSFESDGHLPELLIGDAMRLRQIFLNLYSNANKFTRNGHIRTQVECLTTLEKDWLEIGISIQDTGVGIPADQVDEIFALYAQPVENQTGSGIGLYLCSEFVKKMGGRIWGTSQQGLGTTIHMSIPFLIYAPLKNQDSPGNQLEPVTV